MESMESILPESPIYMLILRGAVVFLFLQALLRISGKRQMSQMGPAELLLIVLIAESVSSSLAGDDHSILGGVVVAATLIGCSLLLEYASFRWRGAQRLIEGAPTVLIHRGKVLESRLNHEWLRRTDLLHMLRQQGVQAVADVDLAVLDTDGSLSILKRAADAPRPDPQAAGAAARSTDVL